MQELKQLKSTIEPYQKSLEKLKELRDLAEISAGDQEYLKQIETELVSLQRDVSLLEVQTLLGGPFDHNNAILSINAGAGGTESCT